MATDQQTAANRLNAQKSTGPKTPEGKEASSKNSIKHGHTTRSTIVLQCERVDEFNEFLAEHIAIHQPATPPELELVDQMAIARWRIRRFVASETVLIDCEIVRNQAAISKEFATNDSGVHIAMAIRSLADESRTLSLMSRYESRLQRCHDKAYAALRELQKSRMSQPPEPEPAPATAPDPAPNPSVSEGAVSIENKILRNEATAPPDSALDVPLFTPVGQVPDLPSPSESRNSEDYEG